MYMYKLDLPKEGKPKNLGQSKSSSCFFLRHLVCVKGLWYENCFTSSDPHHDMSGGGCQVRVIIYFYHFFSVLCLSLIFGFEVRYLGFAWADWRAPRNCTAKIDLWRTKRAKEQESRRRRFSEVRATFRTSWVEGRGQPTWMTWRAYTAQGQETVSSRLNWGHDWNPATSSWETVVSESTGLCMLVMWNFLCVFLWAFPWMR